MPSRSDKSVCIVAKYPPGRKTLPIANQLLLAKGTVTAKAKKHEMWEQGVRVTGASAGVWEWDREMTAVRCFGLFRQRLEGHAKNCILWIVRNH